MSKGIQERLESWRQGQSARLADFAPVTLYGRVQRINGILLQCRLLHARIGDLCQVETSGQAWVLAEIIGFDQQDAMLSALGNLEGICAGAAVKRLEGAHRVRVGNELLGQVLDGFGRPLTGGGWGAFALPPCEAASAVLCEAPLATERPRICRAAPLARCCR